MHSLLEQAAPGLSGKLSTASLSKRREVIAAGCAAVATMLQDLAPVIRELVDKLTLQGELSNEELAAVQSLAETADEEYLELHERQKEQLALARFSEARLLTAITKGFGGTSVDDSADAVYELCSACDDPSAVIREIEAIIS